MHGPHHSRWTLLAVVLIAMLPFGGCASDGADQRYVGTAMTRASTAIAVASTEDVSRFAAAELAIAREKLAAARQSARAGNYAAADRLVSESLVNVQLATAKADAARVRAELQRLRASLPPHENRAPARAEDAGRVRE